MGTKNKFIRGFHPTGGNVEFNNIRTKAQRANLGYFPVSPLSFFKRVLSLTIVSSMLFTTGINTLVSYANEIQSEPVISNINLDGSIALQHVNVGDTIDAVNFPNSLEATIDSYKEVLVEVVDNPEIEEKAIEDATDVEEPTDEIVTPVEAIEETPIVTPIEETPAEVPTEETPVVENPAEQVPAEVPTEEAIPTEAAPVEAVPVVEAAPAPVEEPTIIEETVEGAFNILFPAINVKAAELEEAQPVEEAVETEPTVDIKSTYKNELVKTSTVITLDNVQWSIDESQSTAVQFDSSVAGNTFVFTPVIETEYQIATQLPNITVVVVEKEVEEVGFEAITVVDGIIISVKADPGVFPEGATLSAKRASTEQAEAAEVAVEEKEDAPIVETYSFDISILNTEGLEIQPDNSKGKVSVSFALEEAANEDLNTEVYHMDEQVDGSFEAEKLDSTSAADTVIAETTGFSVYTVAVTGGTVTFENDGYPYGKNMGDTPTLSIRVTNQGAKYQWQSSTNKTSWTDISDATSQDYTFTPVSGTWYRCKVNGAESKAVQMVQPGQDGRTWTNPMYGASWYISNGTMAYSVVNNRFDVTGLYIKNGTKYMLQTVFGGGGWGMVTSTTATPSAGSGNNAELDDLYVTFSDADEYAVIFVADLKAGQKALSFGCDTQLGDYNTSGSYSDSAALEANLNSDKTLKQVAMIGASSSDTAKDDDPAFVIAPITKSGLKFWLGMYYDRQHFSYANGSDSVVADGKTVSNIRLKCNDLDSGMTMSWSNVEDGGKVSFQFSVGDVASTGAVEGNVNYINERIEGLTPGVVYTITEAGTNNTYTKTADANGGIDFAGKDNNNKTYDFIGKTLNFSAVVDDVNLSTTIAVAGRPVATEADTTGTADNTDATKPAEVGKDAVVSSTDSVTLNISLGDTARMSQEYRIYDKDGEPVSGWISPNTNGTVKFNGLTKESDYTIKARIPAKQNVPASVPTAGVPVKTIGTIDIETPEELTTDYNGNANTFLALSGMEGVEISYSTDPNTNYSTDVPEFKMPGIYTVYYKATKEGYRSTYGSYQVIINKIEREQPIYIPGIKTDVDSENTSVDLSDYIGEDDTATVNRVTGDIGDYIYNVRIVDNVLTYNQRESNEEKSGNIVIKVENPIYRDNEVSIPITLPPAIQIEEPQVKTSTYTGKPVDTAMTTTQDDVTIKYSLDPNGEFTEEAPELTNAGNYTIYYEATRPGKTPRRGSYEITINKQYKEDVIATAPVTIPHQATTEGKRDLTAYLEKSAQLLSYTVSDNMADYINIEGIEDGVLKYTIPQGKYGLNGEIKLKVVSDNFKEYEITLPIRTAQAPVVSQEETKYYAPVEKKEDELKEELVEETKAEESKSDKNSDAKNKKSDLELEQKVAKLKDENKLVDKDEVLTNLSTETKKKLVDKLEEKGGQIVATDAMSIANATGTNAAKGSDAVDANKIPVNEVPVALVMGEGAVIVTMELSEDVKSSAGLADAKSVAKSILTEEQYARVASGSIVEIKVEAIPLDTTTVSDFDKQVIDDGVSQCMEELPNLTMGNYIDISMYMRIDDSDWNQITDTEQFEIVIEIPEEYKGLGQTYYIMRAHEGVSTLLEDLDDDPNTITIATGQFSTYAIMFDQTPVVEKKVSLTNDVNGAQMNTITAVSPFAVAKHYLIVLFLIAGFVLVTTRETRRKDRNNPLNE